MRGTRRRISQTSRGEKVAACVAETMPMCGSVRLCAILCYTMLGILPSRSCRCRFPMPVDLQVL